MRIKPGILDHLHLDKTYSLLSALQTRLLYEAFQILDIHENGDLNDIQFWQFMRNLTDLSKSQIYKVFDMLDVNGSGSIDFDEFYFLACILISIKDDVVKQFIFQHSRAVFDLLDADGSKSISVKEFRDYGFLFNYTGEAIQKIFDDFDISGDEEIDFKEFRLFSVACIDAQRQMETERLQKLERRRQLQKLSFPQRIRAMLADLIDVESTNVVTPAGQQSDIEEKPKTEKSEQRPVSSAHKKDNVWRELTELYTNEKHNTRQPSHHQGALYSGVVSLWERCALM